VESGDSGALIPGVARDFSFFENAQALSGVHPTSYLAGAVVLSQGWNDRK